MEEADTDTSFKFGYAPAGRREGQVAGRGRGANAAHFSGCKYQFQRDEIEAAVFHLASQNAKDARTKKNGQPELVIPYFPNVRFLLNLGAKSMIAVPDDFPSVFEGSDAHASANAIANVRVHTSPGAEIPEELVRRLADAEIAINLRSYVRYTEDIFVACPRLRMIAVWGSGTDNIDLGAAMKHGVTVCNTAGVNAGAASEHTFALMLALARKLRTMDAEMREGGWPRDLPRQLSGKTLGVFGVGHVGARVAKLGLAFGMNVLAYSALGDAKRVQELGGEFSSKQRILRESDFVTLHLRLTPPHHRFIGAGEFEAMKPEAILVNTARAHLIDHDALVEALTSGRIGGAGLDAFHEEPTNHKERLLGLGNTVLSPHMAGQSPEVRIAGMQRVVTNIVQYLNGTIKTEGES